MAKREEVLDMAVHALCGLMNRDKQATASDLFDEAVDIGEKLVEKVEEVVARGGTPPRDEMLDMGVHALSALLNGRRPTNVEQVLDESMEAAKAVIARVDNELGTDADDAEREELLDVAVHVQTALLTARPQMPAAELSDQCVRVAKELLARVDREIA